MAYLTEQNKERMVSTFLELVRIDSETHSEGDVARRLTAILKGLGCTVVFDGAGKKTNSQTGNLIAKFPGDKSLPPFILSAHMDTVAPGKGIKPKTGKKRITSDGTTILGADDKAGVAVILEALRIFKERNIKHPPIEVVLSICEEIGLQGAKYLDFSQLKAKSGLVLDTESPREVTVKAPAADKLEIKVHGIASHAGMFPERGISAIRVAAEAISNMKLGRLDEESTANIGVIEGGAATNIITPLVTLRGEARSRNPKKLAKQVAHMRAAFENAAKRNAIKLDGKKVSARIEFIRTNSYPAMNIPLTDKTLRALVDSAKEMGIKLEPKASGGGSDANVFAAHGIFTPNLGCGMWEPHTTAEYLDLEDFFTCAEIAIGAVVRIAGRK
jgi:tripeptide aminopeptidase